MALFRHCVITTAAKIIAKQFCQIESLEAINFVTIAKTLFITWKKTHKNIAKIIVSGINFVMISARMVFISGLSSDLPAETLEQETPSRLSEPHPHQKTTSSFSYRYTVRSRNLCILPGKASLKFIENMLLSMFVFGRPFLRTTPSPLR